ncbi:gp53-like domain-containing protein [Streptomyces broussonetiae]|uniref:Putative tail fiber protein gp53-like C-terminal domain-containing protein n=1 Tax=Streptomyces broussonetiae TaxID=2686304 RepID=A0A6I6NJU5_9ACTN|nr:hypothetical protein [Streptomyces broussonetiae]QHA09245.1 hypothetical protein GQF42_44095 [Streptomyces broussonetiae]
MSMIQTGKVDLSSDQPIATQGGNTSTFTRVTFPTPFPNGSQVIVLAQTQTFNGPETPGIRLADVNNEGFLIRFNEVNVNANVRSDGLHTSETVGWLATTV